MEPLITQTVTFSRSAYGAVDAIPLNEIRERKNQQLQSQSQSQSHSEYHQNYKDSRNNSKKHLEFSDYQYQPIPDKPFDIELTEKSKKLSKKHKKKKSKKNKKKKKKFGLSIHRNYQNINNSDDDDEMCNFNKKRRFRVITESDGIPKQPPMKTTIVAIFLLFFGVSFLMAGFVTWYRWGVYEAIPFWTLGGVTFIPGSYASAIILFTYLGYRGYRYDLIPSYDD